MAVPTTFAELSTTAASNPPADTEGVSEGDNQFRQVYAFIRSLYEGSTNGQIVFPATQNASAGANTLDDYEENTWTPTVTSISGSITAYTASGVYTKVGRVVHCCIAVTITTKGTAAGGMNVTLPFTAGAASCGAGNEKQNTGKSGTIWVGAASSTGSVTLYDGTTPFLSASGDAWIFGITYSV